MTWHSVDAMYFLLVCYVLKDYASCSCHVLRAEKLGFYIGLMHVRAFTWVPGYRMVSASVLVTMYETISMITAVSKHLYKWMYWWVFLTGVSQNVSTPWLKSTDQIFNHIILDNCTQERWYDIFGRLQIYYKFILNKQGVLSTPW